MSKETRIKLPVRYDTTSWTLIGADGETIVSMLRHPELGPVIADALNNSADLEAKLAEVEKERDAYAAMLGEANHIELRYSPACDSVRILVHRRAGKAFLHYRDREGNWLNDHEVDTDFTGNRKVKECDTVLEAYAAITASGEE